MKEEILVGAHTSAAGGAYKALLQGQEIGANTIQFFTSNQKTWHGKEISEDDILLWNQAKESTGISVTMSHDSYLINLGSPNPDVWTKSKTAFGKEIERCHLLDVTYMNFHPGAQRNQFQRGPGFLRGTEQPQAFGPRTETAAAGQHAQGNGQRHAGQHRNEPPEH